MEEDAAGCSGARPNPVLEKSFALAPRAVPFTKRLHTEGRVDLDEVRALLYAIIRSAKSKH